MSIVRKGRVTVEMGVVIYDYGNVFKLISRVLHFVIASLVNITNEVDWLNCRSGCGYLAESILGCALIVGVHNKDVVSILHLLVALARHFRSSHTLPRNVSIKRILLKQLDNKLDSSIIVEQITGDDIGPT